MLVVARQDEVGEPFARQLHVFGDAAMDDGDHEIRALLLQRGLPGARGLDLVERK